MLFQPLIITTAFTLTALASSIHHGAGNQVLQSPDYRIIPSSIVVHKTPSVEQYITDTFSTVSSGSAVKALRIAYKESRYNPTASNPHSSAKGVFQILDGTWKLFHCTGNVYNYMDNTNCALKIVQHDGDWHEWATN